MEKLVFEKWQVKKLVSWFSVMVIFSSLYLGYTTWDLYQNKSAEQKRWVEHLEEDSGKSDVEKAYVERVSKDATEVLTGSYVETIKEINMKTSSFRLVCKVWFKWKGDEELDMMHNFHVYQGTINKLEEIKNYTENGVTYQLLRMDVTIFDQFETKRFPLESHQMRVYIEPDYSGERVKLVADKENFANNPSLNYAGYDLIQADNGIFTMIYDSSYGEDSVGEKLITSEYFTQLELNRNGLGLYLKCFIALFGTSLWVFITLYICTYHKVDPLGMIPAALFGTVSNIMVGANLLPDALEVGLLEYVNVWGVFTILMGAVIIINVNRIRNKFQDNQFAALFGRVMFGTLLFIVLLGHVLMPVAAYRYPV